MRPSKLLIFKKTIAGGDTGQPKDISEMTHWSRLGNVGINAVQSKLSTHRKIGCSLLANMSLSTGNQEGIDLKQLSYTDFNILFSSGYNFEQFKPDSSKIGFFSYSTCSRTVLYLISNNRSKFLSEKPNNRVVFTQTYSHVFTLHDYIGTFTAH